MHIKYCKQVSLHHGVTANSSGERSVLELAPPVHCCSKVTGLRSRTLSGDPHQVLECVSSGSA